ncbi:type II toxin-antitoxin system VapC family toxin [Chamaesiphon sp.]|uniref:type II toxin-antitoxin system VapC family toxin n=1 Tax=Chamaesiphon sp. TaxID=2814140 RepID=UPI003592F320
MGRFLLDTHVFLWLIRGDPQLSDRVRAIIADDASQLNFSVVSIWEIAIKLNIGKLKIEHSIEDIYQLLAQLKIEVLPIERLDLDRYLTLPLHHRDPFDRLIISQAIERDLILISTDGSFEPYSVQRLW